jgi:hypothetical protein
MAAMDAARTENTTASKKVRRMFGLDLDAWNVVMVSFLGVAAIAAVVVGVSTAIIIKLQKQSELESNERIASLVTQGDKLRKDTAEANARAADAQLALERYKAPRELTDAQQANIVNALRKFAGQEYGITTFWDLKEPLAFAEILNRLLQMAGWKFVGDGKRGYILGGLTGVQVWMHPDADPPVKEAVNGLIAALKAEQLETSLKLQNPQNPKSNNIALNVGTKQ